MNLNEHKIQENRFEISFVGEESASRSFQSRFSVILKSRLAPMMDRVMDEFHGEGQFTKINRLQLDLGTVSLRTFEHDIEQKLKEELRKQLKKAHADAGIQQQNSAKTAQGRSEAQHKLELLNYYLMSGRLPWWGQSQQKITMEDLFLQMLSSNKTALLKWLRKKGHVSHLRSRLVKQFNEATLLKLVGSLVPAEREFIKDYVRDIRRAHKKKVITKTSEEQLNEALWDVILSYLLQDRGTRFNRKAFLKWNLSKLAGKYRIEYEELVKRLQHSLDQIEVNQKYHSELKDLIKEISYESRDLGKEESHSVQKRSEALIHFIAFMEGRRMEMNEKHASISQLWAVLLKQEKLALVEAVLLYAKSASVRKRLVKGLSEKALSELVEALEPSHAGFILSFLEHAESIREQQHIQTKSRDDFRQSVWEFVVQFLVEEKGTRFNQKEFVRSNLKHLAIKYRVSFEEVLSYFMEIVEQAKTKTKPSASLPELVIALFEENRETSAKKKAVSYTDSVVIAQWDRFEVLKIYLQSGFTEMKKSRRFEVYKELFNQPEMQLQEFLKASLSSPEAMQRLVSDWNTEEFRRFLKESLLPADYKLVWSFWNVLREEMKFAQTLNIAERRIFFGSVIDMLVSARKPSALEIMQAMAGIAVTHFSVEKKVIIRVAERTSGLKSDEIMEQHLPERTAELIALLAAQPAGGAEVVKKLDKQSAIELLQFLAFRLELQSKVYVHGRSLRWEKVMFWVFKHQPKASEQFFKKPIRVSGLIERRRLTAFYRKSLEVAEKKSGQIPAVSRLKELLGSRVEENRQKAKRTELKGSVVEISPQVLFKFLEGDKATELSETELLTLLESLNRSHYKAIRQYLLQQVQNTDRIQSWMERFSDRVLLRLVHVISGTALAQKMRFTQEVLQSWRNTGGKSATVTTKEIRVLQWRIMLGFSEPIHSAGSQWKAAFVRHVLTTIYEGEKLITPKKINRRQQLMLALLRTKTKNTDTWWKPALNEVYKEWGQKLEDAGQIKTAAIEEQDLAQEKQHEEATEQGFEHDLDEPIYIENAGMVLLGAFLPMYFSRLEFLEGNKFRSPEALYRAVHLLQYMVSGEKEPNEYDLTLNKILCGMDIIEPVPRKVEFKKSELELSDSLLESMIEQWKMIGDTSVVGFRESFLKREGKLVDQEESWQLTVEVKGYDMLLDQLPWSISMVMHKWMQKRIQVEWR
ncbi:contractile injection system tape measure protein [Gracilimonas mengyeensis]|uniref:Uncharacterized protein n=1 Tax=Gracilimonas mengyeensis TaxID=1302730 RepID=A0A521BNL1_9BACT|nr:contractile injection system tape measure protein [Gracilimonas mengyeensis]SMO48723.1 hypothetical protein SAMN06265219_102427 [Gracilimonas mengyeensis]